MVFKSVISRVIILILLILTVGVGTSSLFFIKREHSSLIASTRENAELLLSTVEKSIFSSMRAGNSADVQTVLEMIGRSHRLASVRIFHPDGTILRSARPEEIGTQISRNEIDLFRYNRREGVFRDAGAEVLGLIKPIVSDERCFICHGYGRKVIGVLNLNLALDSTAEKLRDTTQFFLFSTGLIILVLISGISIVLLRFVKRPIQEMADKMAQVESGDLSVRLQPRFSDEIGTLMSSFNSMVDNLEKTRKELQTLHLRQMERADRLASVGEMSTGLAHEIKNPLAGISSAISVLADDFSEDDIRREIVRQVLEQIARLDKTATDLLHFGRPGKPEFSYVDINALVKKTLFFIDQHPEARNIHRVKELTRDLPLVWVDEKQIQQVLLNVLINGIQAMREGGTLLVQTEGAQAGGREVVRLLVRDTGRGISPEDQEKIFAPFHTTKMQGTGLGLPISRQLLEQHGGTIRVESRPGEGATFIIELPVVEQPASPKEVNSA